MASTAGRLRYTPVADLLRGQLTARLDWRGQINSADLPAELKELVFMVVRATRLWRADRAEVAADLLAHFTDGLDAGSTCAELIQAFGQPRQAALLIRSSKIHGRPITWYLLRTAYTLLGLLCVAYAALAIRYYSGAPSQKSNYILQLNQVKAPSQAGATPIYQSALAALGNHPWDPVLSFSADGRHWPEIARWVDKHEALIEQVRRTSALPIRGPSPENALNQAAAQASLPEPRDIRALADILAFDAKRAREKDEGRRVEADIVALIQLAAQQKIAAATHVAELASLGLLARAYDELDRTLVEKPQVLDGAAVVRLAHRISIPTTAGDLISFGGERAMFQDILLGTFTDDGHGDGRLSPQGWNFYQAAFGQSACFPEQLLTQPPAAVVVQPGSLLLMSTRKQLSDEYDRIMAMNEAMIRVPLREADTNAPLLEAKALASSTASRLRYAELLPLIPSLQRETEIAERTLGQRDGLLVGLALEMYHREHQHYPDTLEQLTPGLLPQVLPDRITGDPLKYRLIDGKPLVYSVGVDRIDDHGRVPFRNGKPAPTDAAQWGDIANSVQGDWVLYPQPRISQNDQHRR